MKFSRNDIIHFYGEVEGKTGRIRPAYYEYLAFPFTKKRWNEIIARIKNDPDVKGAWAGRLPDNLMPFLTSMEARKVFSIGDPNDVTFQEVNYDNYDEKQEKKHNELLDSWIVNTANYLMDNPDERDGKD